MSVPEWARWDEAPPQAHFVRGTLTHPEPPRWVVYALPPAPWPDVPPPPLPRAKYGPPGTEWRWNQDAATSWAADQAKGHLDDVLRFLARKFRPYPGPVGQDDPLFTGLWVTPTAWADPALPVDWRRMRYLQTVIHGKLGTVEEVSHVVKYRLADGTDGDLSPAQVKTFGDLVRDKWHDFLNADVPSATTIVRNFITDSLQYDEVRTAYLEVTAPRAKPAYIVPTTYSTFDPSTSKGQATGASLPWEVAMCLSLNTNFRGPRNRGRLYLGPFHPRVMDVGGLFGGPQSLDIATAFGEKFVAAVNTLSLADVHVVSNTWATSAAVQGVKIGVVPDSQRRRRRSQVESYRQAWGTGVGLAA